MTETTKPTLGPAGRRLWESTTAVYTLEDHEDQLLLQACRAADTCHELDRVIEAEGYMVDGKVNPAVKEARAQRVLFSRLVVALRIPLGAPGDTKRPQLRAIRGAYAPRS